MQKPYPIYDQNGQNWLKSIPYLWPKRLKNHTLWVRTYLYSPYKGVPPRPFFRWDRQKLLVDPTPVEKFVSQLGTWPAATRVFLPTTRGGREERPWEQGCACLHLIGRFSGISRKFGQAMVRILERHCRAKIPMTRLNEPGVPSKRTVRLEGGR